jgi:predicted RNA-binding Zn-ribbon protein involved in translation (DUF1610 family)
VRTIEAWAPDMTTLLILGAVILIGMFLVVHGTIFQTRWGINTATQIKCPRCGNMHGQIRTPRNLRQFLWGGYTCNQCGLQVDKWNRPTSG